MTQSSKGIYDAIFAAAKAGQLILVDTRTDNCGGAGTLCAAWMDSLVTTPRP